MKTIEKTKLLFFSGAKKEFPLLDCLHIVLRTIRRWLDILTSGFKNNSSNSLSTTVSNTLSTTVTVTNNYNNCRILEKLILVSPFPEHCKLCEELLQIYFPRFNGEGQWRLKKELNLFLKTHWDNSLMNTLSRNRFNADFQGPTVDNHNIETDEGETRLRRELLCLHFLGDGLTGEVIESNCSNYTDDLSDLKQLMKRNRNIKTNVNQVQNKDHGNSESDSSPTKSATALGIKILILITSHVFV